MIEIEALEKRSEKGAACNVCGRTDTVKALRFSRTGHTGSTTIYLCWDCREDLRLDLEESHFADCRQRDRENGGCGLWG